MAARAELGAVPLSRAGAAWNEGCGSAVTNVLSCWTVFSWRDCTRIAVSGGRSVIYKLLSIYDDSDEVGRKQGGHSGSDVYSAGIQGIKQLQDLFNDFIIRGIAFRNMVFTTHGIPGAIDLGDDRITYYTWYNKFNSGHYERLFLDDARVYFDGCNVAAGEDGWKFLEAAARTFMRGSSGQAFGWTSVGYGMPSWVWFIGGHTEHLSGHARYVFINPAKDGGLYLKRWPENEEED